MEFGQLIHEKLGSPSPVIKISDTQVLGVHEDFQRSFLTYLLNRFHGNQVKTAACLGINRNTLRKRIEYHRIDVETMRTLYAARED